MRFQHRVFLVLVVLAVATTPSPAVASPYDTEVLITPYAESTTFAWATVLSLLPQGAAPEPTPPIVVSPVHGELVSGPGELLHYTPDSSFWELGTDSFIFHVAALEPAAWVTVTLQASDQGDYSNVYQPFEGPVGGLTGDAEVTPEAALAGLMGLRATTDDGLSEPAVFSFSHYFHRSQGPGAAGGTEELKLAPPPPPPSPWWGGETADPVVIYTMDRLAGPGRAADLVLTPDDGVWELSARLYEDGTVHQTPSFLLEGPEYQLALDWWASLPGRTGGLALRVDGKMVGSITGISDWAVDENRQVGVMLAPTATTGATIAVDDIRLSSADEARATFAPILRDDFEDDLWAWQTSAPYIDVTPGAALIGLWGLEIEPVAGSDGALLDPSPTAETSVGIRMRLSTDGLAMLPGSTFEFLALSARDAEIPDGDQARLVLRRDLDGFKLIAQALSGGAWQSAPLADLTAGTHTVELRWQAADPGDANGWMELWVDGEAGARIDGLVNGDSEVESVRLGAWNVEPGAQGALFVDAYESWSAVPRKEDGV